METNPVLKLRLSKKKEVHICAYCENGRKEKNKEFAFSDDLF
jgi:hypothetical protein